MVTPGVKLPTNLDMLNFSELLFLIRLRNSGSNGRGKSLPQTAKEVGISWRS
jgi:hypothetical protein